jgi:hypothetical protein
MTLRTSLFVVLCALSACGADGRFVLLGSARAPSASGIVEVDDLGGDSAQVAVHLEYLHPPGRLDSSLKSFVVWFVPPVGGAVRAGTLRYDSALRTGDLTQTSPFHHFTLLVTAEREQKPPKPSAYVVATQEVIVD